jgi:hypothetical protein
MASSADLCETDEPEGGLEEFACTLRALTNELKCTILRPPDDLLFFRVGVVPGDCVIRRSYNWTRKQSVEDETLRVIGCNMQIRGAYLSGTGGCSGKKNSSRGGRMLCRR